jgi:hypothetical protein
MFDAAQYLSNVVELTLVDLSYHLLHHLYHPQEFFQAKIAHHHVEIDDARVGWPKLGSYGPKPGNLSRYMTFENALKKGYSLLVC